MPKPRVEPDSVFLNIPYDRRFERLYLAYIVGLTELSLTPKATLAIPGGTARLDRIFELIQTCRYSIHDLSRVQLDRVPPPTPRFNMPFELGLALGWAKLNPGQHTWFVFETANRRAQKSISDLNGTDCNIHDGQVQGVMRELRNAFVRRRNQPDVPQMMENYEALRKLLPGLRRQTGAETLFEAGVFNDLITVAARLRDKRSGG
ncbi:hypothetical protein [Paracidobacterium acidisoli]|uniref:Uncharacterized protein n=1 Tax=Paracidobacterium acidisoli TaxID=2303751 RepID=A0A372ITD9_9BACT|nr:hypothetical protein [Paracidobacterium acidisoli]MBT9329453.1 hypothetical protein [Paracidobacterium acidisoli]